ncbi:winged helix-turn-helix transcriptional regulator [Cellulomonas fimi]|uniref:Transcriptional regulator, HxlR family n=1 Tax=Cellulomonas fimi (strain ATCC 484 / DSM 20113 / JCM 1341 / CCUG 24087 / LMG 16345 / NBRC 15513 / NCIMB 8980 / NCTC 7547 / NRS-133) TaxID=590998 RepID=F4H5D8_CELFA|nr:helix-turn-helix domain-containing protein [Cellulomonas fimi]AEE47861.1 transcriptional regulator, HxlR family [Cellulomonas fimi ATCC 484]NNH06001.1 helix-turn-helix transcriptional regulator [Cellulomonas fimi]
MSTYGQFCGVARALDVVGERWTLLLVRELLVAPRRFTDLRDGLPGIAPNLLSRRLTALQDAGVVERRLADRGTVYALTPWGEELRGVVRELVRWAARSMAGGPAPDDAFHPEWLVVAMDALLDDVRTPRPVRVAVHVDGWWGTLDAGPDGVRVATGRPDDRPVDATVSAPGPLLLGVASGAVPFASLATAGLVSGDADAAQAVLAAHV